MKDICKYNKMIYCHEQNKCSKCVWNPTYYESLKQEKQKERKKMYYKAIAKLESKKPLISTDSATPVCNCPECEQLLYVEQKYCDNCGQKLDWRE